MEAIKEYLLLPPCQQQSWQGGLLSLWRLVRGRGEESGWERSSISTNAFIIWKEKNITKHIWSSWWWEWCQRKRRFPQTLLSGGRFMAGTRQRWKATQCGEGGGLVLFVQDNTQQHTEMLRGATDSTDGRISEIPRRYKCISNTNTEKSRQTEKTRSENNQFVIQVRIQSNFWGKRWRVWWLMRNTIPVVISQ